LEKWKGQLHGRAMVVIGTEIQRLVIGIIIAVNNENVFDYFNVFRELRKSYIMLGS